MDGLHRSRLTATVQLIGPPGKAWARPKTGTSGLMRTGRVGLLRVEVAEEVGQQLPKLLVLLPGQLHRPREGIGYVGHTVP